MAEQDNTPTGTIVETTPAKTRRRPDSITKLINAGVGIDLDAPESEQLTYMHSIMCQVGLPRSAVFGDEFERVCGNAALGLDVGRVWNGKMFVRQPLPFGPWPRLIMAYLNTEALRSQSPEIDVCDSASAFIRRLGKTPNGGVRSTYTSFRKQMLSLSACHMTLGFTVGEKATTYYGKPVKQFEAWLSNEPNQRTLWPACITLSQDYFDSLNEHAVPLDLRALDALSGSALAMDAYAMLAQRLRRIEGRPVVLHWKNLHAQFGQEYADPKNFKRAFLSALKKVLVVYPKAKVKVVTGGILMMASPPPVLPKF